MVIEIIKPKPYPEDWVELREIRNKKAFNDESLADYIREVVTFVEEGLRDSKDKSEAFKMITKADAYDAILDAVKQT